jgi:peptide-methionine (S)-S-oxide reductase
MYNKKIEGGMKIIIIVLYMAISTNLGAKPMAKEIATLAGGCFWGMEEIIRAIPGVINTTVGYTGGSIENPTYNIVKLGTSNHAEAVEVEFDPSKISFAELLNYFFRMHDPTTLNRQMNDIGTQYRSAIFYHSLEQQQTSLEAIKKQNSSGKWKNPVVTQVLKASKFYPAEEYHQDYLKKNPNGYTCHWLRD